MKCLGRLAYYLNVIIPICETILPRQEPRKGNEGVLVVEDSADDDLERAKSRNFRDALTIPWDR